MGGSPVQVSLTALVVSVINYYADICTILSTIGACHSRQRTVVLP